MINDKIKVYHFSNGSGGGVFSVITNLLKYSSDTRINNHLIYAINKKSCPNFQLPKLEGAESIQVFYYSPKWNFYYTCKQLAKLLPDDKAVVVAHDWLELGMVSNLGLQNPVVQIVHGNYDYYYDLVKKHEASVESYIAVSPAIHKKLCSIFPPGKESIHYCRFPVPAMNPGIHKNKRLKIFYCVRDLADDNKQFNVLPLVNEKLRSKGLQVHWTIIGEGKKREEVEDLMNQKTNLVFFPSLLNKDVLKLLPEQDLFILPSLREGFPVSIPEAMKAGAVPLVTNWGDATSELIIENETGYYFETLDANGYAERILRLNGDRELLKRVACNGIKKSNELFDPFVNTKKIEEVIVNASYKNRPKKKAVKVYGSRLDKLWIPNWLVKGLRSVNILK